MKIPQMSMMPLSLTQMSLQAFNFNFDVKNVKYPITNLTVNVCAENFVLFVNGNNWPRMSVALQHDLN